MIFVIKLIFFIVVELLFLFVYYEYLYTTICLDMDNQNTFYICYGTICIHQQHNDNLIVNSDCNTLCICVNILE